MAERDPLVCHYLFKQTSTCQTIERKITEDKTAA